MRKRILSLVLAAIILTLCASCSNSTPDSTGNATGDPTPPSISTSTTVAAKHTEEPTPEPANLYPGELLYKSMPVSSFLGASKNLLAESLGTPSSDEWNLLSYDGIAFNYYAATSEIYFIQLSPGACEIDGITLDKSREGLIAILGNPANEDYNEEGSYVMNYTKPYYSFSIMLPSPDDDAQWIYFSFDLGKWVQVEEISMDIPSTWDYSYEGVGGYISFDIDCMNKNVSMQVFQSRSGTDDLRSYTFDGGFTLDGFTFNNGTKGYCAYDDNKALFTYGNSEAHYLIDYSADPEWYRENKAFIYVVAKTLTCEFIPYEENDNPGSGDDGSTDSISADGYIINSGSTVYVKGGGYSLMGSLTEGVINFKEDGEWTITWVAVLESMGINGWERNEIYKDGLVTKFYSPTTKQSLMFHSPSDVSLDKLYINP